MVYVYTVKKTEKDRGVSPILELVDRYMTTLGSDNFIVSLPGYMSTKSHTLTEFHKNFPIIKNTTSNIGYFFKGMNGSTIVDGTTHSIQTYINNLYGNYDSTFSQLRDHSKVTVFFKNLDNKLVANNNIDDLIKYGEVDAILLGSSNQSYNTYLKSPTDKGEADILLVDESMFSNDDNLAINLISDTQIDNIIISREIYSKKSLRDLANIIFGL